MKESYTSKRRVRKNFGRIDSVSEMPSLIEVQTGSYRDFIENKNCEFGLEEVFKSIFPIKDFSGTGELEFVKYELEEPKYDVDECIKRDMTYAAPVKATLRLVVWDVDEATGSRSIHDIKEQDVYMGDIPLMTDKGTFIVNGTERVVVSQMHRSPGVFFDNDKGKTVASGKYLFAARVIPYRGSWLDFEFDAKDLLYARIDRRRKLPVTSILYSLYSKETEEKLKELAKEELSESKKRVEELEQELKILLLPKDPNDDKNVIVEIRAGAGGDEAALFAAEIYRMYVHYADSRRWKTEMISLNENGIGGFKEVVFMITGQGAYSRMKYESGVHRVQRVPETESGGRIHTSTITVAVMPEAEEVDVVIDEKDIRIDVMRASGNGGQCVNTTDSAVRLTHYPTGIVIYSQTEKSQLQNKEKAFRLLRSKLYELELEKQHSAEAEARRSQIGTGDRSEKIRTYNFPQGRVTDHRIKLTLHKLDSIMNGELDEVIDSLIAADQAAKLASMNEAV